MRTASKVFLLICLIPAVRAEEPDPGKPFYDRDHRGASYLVPENTLAALHLSRAPDSERSRDGPENAECRSGRRHH